METLATIVIYLMAFSIMATMFYSFYTATK